jgi:hypothetical protein
MGLHLDWLGGTARAQADAQRLRDLYGRNAEAWCADALAALPRGDPRRGEVQKIARALRAMPTAVGQAADVPARVSRPWIAAVLRRI